MTVSVYLFAYRARKVAALLSVLETRGMTALDMRCASDLDWQQFAAEAGVMLPSAETRRLAIERLAELEAEQKAEATWQDAQMQETGSDRCPTRE